MHPTIRLLLSGISVSEIAALRIEIAKTLLGAKRSCVDYVPGATKCPMCQALGLEQWRVTVERTDGTKRHCICSRCSVTFTAVADVAPESVAKRGGKKKGAKNVED